MSSLIWVLLTVQAAFASGNEHGATPGAAGAEEHAASATAHAAGLVPPWESLGMAAVALTLFVVIMVRLAGRPISDFLRGRALTVQHALDSAGKLRSDAQARFDEVEGRLAGLHQKIEAMRAEAVAQGEQEAQVLEHKAAADAARIRAAAERTIRDEWNRARQSLRTEMAEAAATLAADQIRRSITEADRQRLDNELLTTIHGREAR